MNIAFPALLIILLVVPGIVLHRWYRRGSWESPVVAVPVGEEIAASVTSALFLHGLWVLVVQGLYEWGAVGGRVDLESVLILLGGGGAAQERAAAISSVIGHPYLVVTYFATINLFAFWVGWSAHHLVRDTHWDITSNLLRFKNEWYYLLYGEHAAINAVRSHPEAWTLESRDIEKVMEGYVFTYVSVVVEQGGVPYLYWGVLDDFYFDKDGSLDRLVLTTVYRRKLSDDRSNFVSAQSPSLRARRAKKDGGKRGAAKASPATDSSYYGIDGDYLVVRYDDVKTLNVDYVTTTKLMGEQADRD